MWSPSYHAPFGFAQESPYTFVSNSMRNGGVRGSDVVAGNSRGGAIVLYDIHVVPMFSDLTISDTYSAGVGGAFSISSCTPEILIYNGQLANLTAPEGGAFFIEASPFLTITDSTFNNVGASSRGGQSNAVALESDDATTAGQC